MSPSPASRPPGQPPQAGNRIGEAFTCLALGMRDSLKPGLLFLSIQLWLAALLGWALVFYLGRDGVGSGALVALKFLMQGGVSLLSGGHLGVADDSMLLVPPLGPVLAWLVALGAYVLLAMVTVALLLEWLLMPRIQRQCLTRYPHLVAGSSLSWQAGLRDFLGIAATFVAGGLLCLLIPVVGAALFFVLACYLSVRSLLGDALDGVAGDGELRQIVQRNRVTMALLGLVLAVLLLVPLVGWIAPALVGSAVCHLGLRDLGRLRPSP